ncbi:MAG TPA: molybdenum cofactor biosynthesis protein MoaE [Ignavibacteria bacterium]|nr:molybdopterin converting factor [Bacteroidota bacterium]HRI84352.1 molybdenum cofactor biosynthesis protein MoaE [Ignavibacteria bacterium]HRJ98851.1 molybdenum cofactor biosynthesis protein MoaE [Ignavibacteria bacterium]
MKLKYKYLSEGKIDPEKIYSGLKSNESNTDSGAQFIFIGRVRSDIVNERKVKALLYSAYNDMAEKIIGEIREEIINEFELTGLDVIHGIGNIKAGEISFYVSGISAHRSRTSEAVDKTVKRIKKEVPIWKKDVF